MDIQRCRGGPTKRRDRGRIAATASAPRPPRSPSELAFTHSKPSAGSNQRYVLAISPDLAGELACGTQMCGGSSSPVGPESGLIQGFEGALPPDRGSSKSRRGGKVVSEGAWESHGRHYHLSFRPGLDGGERLLVLLSLLPSLGRPDSDVGVGSDPAEGHPEAGFGGVRVPSDGCGSPSLTGGAVVEEAIAPELPVS